MPQPDGGPIGLAPTHGSLVFEHYTVPLAENLAAHRPAYAPDLPGFGDSGKPNRALNIPELAGALGR